ncbi:SMP-30/gluconolactonase/LRE family protein, partial [Terriglobus sp. YAF25]
MPSGLVCERTQASAEVKEVIKTESIMHLSLRSIVAGVASLALSGLIVGQTPRDAGKRLSAPAIASGGEIIRFDPGLDALIAPGTKIEKVASGFTFAEGPMWQSGRLLFSDVKGNKMYALTPDGNPTLLMDHSGGVENVRPDGGFKGSNGIATNKDGSVLMTQHGARRIVRLDEHLKPSTFLDRFEGKRFNSPNDLVFAPDGALWFTDPPYGLDRQDSDPTKELKFNGVFRYANGKLTAPIRDLSRPNGIGLTRDGKTLYVSNSGPEMFVEKYKVAADGSVSNGTRFIEYPGSAPDVPDGLKLDSADNLWTSGPGGIRVISPSGKVLGQIKLPEVAANLAWADDGRTLY